MTESSKIFLNNLHKVNLVNCRASAFGNSNLVTCHSGTELCSWRQCIGGNILCTHTLNFMIAQTSGLTQLAVEA